MLNQDDARSYHRWQFRIGGLRFLISSGYLCALLVSGLAARLRDLLAAWMPQWWLAVPAAVLVIGLGLQILTLPLSLLGGFWLPRRNGLHHQTFARWLMDRVKAGIIGGILGVAAALIVYALLRSTPWWWLWAAATLFLGQVLLAFVTPIWLVPIFYRLTPLTEGDMRSRLLRLAERARVPAIGDQREGSVMRSLVCPRSACGSPISLAGAAPPMRPSSGSAGRDASCSSTRW